MAVMSGTLSIGKFALAPASWVQPVRISAVFFAGTPILGLFLKRGNDPDGSELLQNVFATFSKHPEKPGPFWKRTAGLASIFLMNRPFFDGSIQTFWESDYIWSPLPV